MSKKEEELTPVVLERSWPGVFKRAVRDEQGNVLELVQFQPGVVKGLTEIQLEAVQDDLENNLSIVDGMSLTEEHSGDDANQNPSSDVPVLPFDGKINSALFKNGIKTLDQLKVIMSRGDDWYESVDGIGEATAEKITEALAE